jgi:CheY-like chemotaxis protein
MRPGEDPLARRRADKDWWDEESLALLTHELRNGLGPIASALQILRLQGCCGGPVAEQACAIIERQAAHLAELVDRLAGVAGLPAVQAGEAGAGGSATGDRLAETRSQRILVVDDNRDAADSAGTLLLLWGHQVRVAYDGPRAVDVAREYQPDLCLVDLGMPGMDGYQVARQLRQEPALARTLLVALTGFDRDADRKACHEAGFDAYLVKPVDVGALRDLLAGKKTDAANG